MLIKYRFPVFSGLALLAVLFLFVGGPNEYSLRSVQSAWGLGHFVCFGLLAYLYVVWRGGIAFWRVLAEVLILTFLLGGLTEILQSFVGRTPLWIDLWHDILGAMLVVLFYSVSRFQLSLLVLKGLQLAVLLLVIPNILPLGRYIVDEAIARHQFPLLSGFETPFELSRWSDDRNPRIVADPVLSGQGSLMVELTTDMYSGITLNYFPRDWSDYNALNLQVYLVDQEPLYLNLRIHDIHHNQNYADRFNTQFRLNQGWNHLKIHMSDIAAGPVDRRLDLARIGGLGVFVVAQEQSKTIIIDEVQLLP